MQKASESKIRGFLLNAYFVRLHLPDVFGCSVVQVHDHIVKRTVARVVRVEFFKKEKKVPQSVYRYFSFE